MTRLALALYLTLTGLPAQSQEAMTGESFDNRTKGKVTVFERFDGLRMGLEEYHDDRTVRIRVEGESCREGRWFEAEGQICYTYDGWAERGGIQFHCWFISDGPGGMIARPVGEWNPQMYYRITITNAPLKCLAPNLGV
ncbi:hypothetical protein RXV86_01435 [Alisedimentitalea sp. MJ-SS2]|uniref:hypothetical protein n=1 Tax=Aliisedimentitalea sp. MJ-SS2 TaxID=3049795 RepID=UPI00291400AE|nr:hypothetical protein [Alisedimentitalea sp. MJ-SS2]MDU8926038.1 hypothetical protein [Alisedimentitalea sp. MJ-SS2]